jgi:peroxiredoxin
MDPLIPSGQPAPDFTLPDLTGRLHSLSEQRGRLAIVAFWSAECPWSKRVDCILLDQMREWGERVALLSIASNDNEEPDLLARVARERGLPLVLLDEGHSVSSLYGAQTTPHLFLVDANGILRYQGAMDDVTFRQREPTRHYLLDAVEALFAGRNPDPAQSPPYGCALVRYDS